ncbi:MAG: hypothetical protein KAG99_01635 [Bacteroidales bacterium]|nr:hypothetical protein [Bacteroidales bacterium]
MIAKKKEFYGGFAMLAGFSIVLVLMFMPVLDGHNAMEYSDSLYNSISKGSAYYIPKIKKEIDVFSGTMVNVTLSMADGLTAEQTGLLFMKGGGLVNVSQKQLKVSGDLAKILANCLADADAMYFNKGNDISDKYGYDERQVLYNWYQALNTAEKDLKKQKKFAEAKMVAQVLQKAVECSYNYYQIEPQKISDRLGIVIFSLLFYVVYTLWYGFAILFMFEGWGMKLEH